MGGIKFTIKKVLGGYYFLVMSFIFGCCVSCKQTVNNIDKTDSKNIKILNENTILSISLDEIIDSVSYIALDTKECLLADIEVVKRDNEYLFIKDKNRLFVFDNNGNFISQISNIGNAPHEYIYIKDFYLDKKNKYIFIISYPDKKLLQYSYNGDFISSSNNLPEEISSISSAILLTKDSLMIYNALSNDINTRISEYALYLNNPYKFEIKPLIKGIDNKSDKIHYPFIYKPMTFLDNKLFMISALSNTVYSFEKGILTDTFSICLPNLAPPVSLLKDNEGLDFTSLKKVVKEEGYGLGITGISTIDSCLVLLLDSYKTLITDCNEGILVGPNIYDKNTDVYLSNLFTTGISEDYLGFYDASYLLDIKEYIMQNSNMQLKEILRTLTEENNPVVFQYHFKKELFTLLKSLVEKK